MSGSVFFAIAVFVIMFVFGIFMSPWFLIPAVLIVAFVLLATPIMGGLKGTGGARKGSGTPSTGEASYDPVSSPGDRTGTV